MQKIISPILETQVFLNVWLGTYFYRYHFYYLM